MLDLTTIKQHCRLELDYTGEDALLTAYSSAAQRYVEKTTDRTLYATTGAIPIDADGESLDEDALVLNESISVAMLLLVGHWYANREAVTADSMSEAPLAVESLIQPYRIYGV